MNLGQISKLKNKSLDIATGDGTYLFLHAGGKFNLDFDFYTNTNSAKFSHEKFIDIYDTFSSSYKPKIKDKAKFNFDVVTDWKKGLLQKQSLAVSKKQFCMITTNYHFRLKIVNLTLFIVMHFIGPTILYNY